MLRSKCDGSALRNRRRTAIQCLTSFVWVLAFCGEVIGAQNLRLRIEFQSDAANDKGEKETRVVAGDPLPMRCVIENRGEDTVEVPTWYTFANPQTIVVAASGKRPLSSLVPPPSVPRSSRRALESNERITFEFDLLSIYPPSISPCLGVGSLWTPDRYSAFFFAVVPDPHQAGKEVRIESNRVAFEIVPLSPKKVAAALKAFARSSPADQARHAVLLGSVGESIAHKSRVIGKLLWAIRGRTTVEVKELAVYALLRIDRASLPLAYLEKEAVEGTNSHLSAVAAMTLGLVGSRRNVPVLIRALKKGNRAAIRALGDVGDRRAVGPLRELAEKSSPEWKEAIEINIRRIEARSMKEDDK